MPSRLGTVSSASISSSSALPFTWAFNPKDKLKRKKSKIKWFTFFIDAYYMVLNGDRERVVINSFSMHAKVQLCSLFLNNFDRVAAGIVEYFNVAAAVVAVLANLYVVVRAILNNVNTRFVVVTVLVNFNVVFR